MLPQVTPNPKERYEPFPLMEMQQAYWLGRNPAFELGGVGIHFYEELDCRGLDLRRLNSAWQKTLLRHDALRTVVVSDGQQRVMERAEYNIAIVDVGTESELHAIRERLSHRCYAVEHWPTFEIVAGRLDAERTRLFVSIDLNFTDFQGLGLIFQDWTRLYQERDADWPEPTISFRDYVLALKALESTKEFQISREYWSEAVAQLPAHPDLPTGNAWSAIGPPRFERRSGVIDCERWSSIRALAARAGVTPACAVLAVYGEVLRLWSAEAAFAVNVTVRNYQARHADIGRIAGVFTSTAPIAFRPMAANFRQRARSTQADLSELLRHRFAGSIWVMREWARAQGKTAGQAVLPVVFTSTLKVEPHPLPLLERLGERVYHLVQTPQVCLDLQLYERAGEMIYQWDTVSAAFPPGVPQDMADSFGATLTSLAAEPAWSRTRVCGMPESQSERCIRVNSTQTTTEPLHADQLVWRDLHENEARPALLTSHDTVTHSQLHRVATQIATSLRHLGAKTDELVAVVLEKSWMQVAAVHGILLAGAAYVPIAPDLPQSRFLYLLKNSEARIAVTTRALRERLEWPAEVEILAVDKLSEHDFTPLFVDGRSPENLAYVLYTSGSTGEPKGVMIEHRNVVNRLLDVNRRFAIGEDDRVLALTAIQHDLSVYDLFGILAAGGAAVLPDDTELRNPAHWVELMAKHRVTIWNSVPAYFDMLVTYLEYHPASAPQDLRLVLLAGDWIPVSLPDRLRAILPETRLIALGGPTETTVWDICYPVARVDPAWRSIPYGTPMENTQYYVMNEQLEERPDWVRGELFIGGAGLSRGYWRDSEKTNRRFVSHPETGERLYRSGDLGRRLPDGNIELMGRADSQLKIRGHRVEAEEVALAIRRHPAVGKVLVRAEGDPNRGVRLVAYVVLNKSKTGYAPRRKSLDQCEQLEFRLRQLGIRNHDRRVSISLRSDSAFAGDQWLSRRSCRSFAEESVSFRSLAHLLGLLRGVLSEDAVAPRRLYPSAGGLYPVRCYVCAKEDAVSELPRGTYYYHPIENTLQRIGEEVADGSAHLEHNRGLIEASGFVFVLAAQFDAIEPVYGALARDYCLLEVGYIGQLLMMGAAELGIGLCPIGDLDRDRMGELLKLEPREEILHAMAGGVPGEACAQSAVRLFDWGQEIRKMLFHSLPEYMIPDHIAIVDAFKLTANGKIDINALPSIDEAACGNQPEVEPSTPGAREIAAVLCEILAVERVPANRGFLELGCNSVQLVELMVRLQARLERDISITEIFEHPTVESLASFLNTPEPVTSGNNEPLQRAALRSRLRSSRVR